MQPMALFDAQGRSIRRTRTSEEILADIPPEVKEARRIIAAGGDPGPMPIDRLLYFGSPRHLELTKNRPDYFGIAPPDYDIDRPEDLTVHGGSLLFGPMPQALSKIMTKYGEVFVPQDLALTAQTQWKTQPGIQVISGEHGADCCCVCCCCKEPEPKPVPCPCPTDKPISIGVFVEGVPGGDAEDLKKPESTMQYLCGRYPGESHYFKTFSVDPSEPAKESDLADYIAEMLWERICTNTEVVDGNLRRCPVNIDLFGFSRGGAVAARVAHLLDDKRRCTRCDVEEDPSKIKPVRFLGLLDPNNSWTEVLFFVHGFEVWKSEISENVETLFIGYGNQESMHTRYRIPGKKRDPKPTNEYPGYKHSEMGESRIRGEKGDATLDPTLPLEDLRDAYNSLADAADFLRVAKGVCAPEKVPAPVASDSEGY